MSSAKSRMDLMRSSRLWAIVTVISSSTPVSSRNASISFFTFSLLPQNSIGCITPKVLAKELKDLEEHQLIKRIVVDDYPVKILYKAEPCAKTITPIIEVLKTWGQNHRKKLFAGGKMEEVESVL